MLIISNSMQLVIVDTTTVIKIVKSHVPVLNTLSPRDNFSCIRLVVQLTPTDGMKFLSYH
jgi:hypothetical protein